MDLLNVVPFKVGDIIESDYDKPVLIIKVINRKGWYHYKGIRLDEEQIRVNGRDVTYAHGSIAMFRVIGHNPAAQVLYSTKES
jgi:hypothetical protein